MTYPTDDLDPRDVDAPCAPALAASSADVSPDSDGLCSPSDCNPIRDPLHNEILALAPLEAALTLRLAEGLSLLDRRASLDALGASCFDDIAREGLGFSPAHGRDLLRIARKLPALPSLEKAFRAALLSKSHLLSLLKVAKPETDRGWLVLSLGRSLRQLEALVRAETGEPRKELVTFQLTPKTFSVLRWGVDFIGRLDGAPLSRADALEAMATEAITSFGAEEEIGENGRKPPEMEKVDEAFLRNPPPLTIPDPPPLPELPDPSQDEDPWEVLATTRAVQRRLGGLLHRKGTLLRKLRDSGTRSPFKAYVAWTLREDPSHVFHLIRRDERLDRSPRLRQAYASGLLSGEIVDRLLDYTIPGTEEAWVEHALRYTVRWLRWEIGVLEELRRNDPDLWEGTKGMPQGEEGMRKLGLQPGFSARELERLLKGGVQKTGPQGGFCEEGGKVCAPGAGGGARAGGARGAGGGAGAGGPRGTGGEPGRVPVRFRLAPEVRRLLEVAIGAVRATQKEVRDEDGALLFLVTHTAECQAGGLAGLEKIARRHPIHERDRWMCAAPGCSRTGRFHRHHVIPRSRDGPDEPWALVSVCSVHHALIHDRLVGCWLDLERVFARGDGSSRERVMWGFGRLPGGRWRVTYRGDARAR